MLFSLTTITKSIEAGTAVTGGFNMTFLAILVIGILLKIKKKQEAGWSINLRYAKYMICVL